MLRGIYLRRNVEIGGLGNYQFQYSITEKLLVTLNHTFEKNLYSEETTPDIENEILALVSKESPTLKSKFIIDLNTIAETAFDNIHALSAHFAKELTELPEIRSWYLKTVKSEIRKIRQMVESGKIGWLEASEKAHAIRNEVMEKGRKRGNAIGLVIARILKKTGREYTKLLNKYLKEIFPGKTFEQLTDLEKQKLYAVLVERAGSPNVKVTKDVHLGKFIGRGLWIVTAALAAHHVIEAENKIEETGRQVSIVAGAVAGGATGAKLGIIFGGPIAYITAPLGSIIGSIAGAVGAENLFDEFID